MTKVFISYSRKDKLFAGKFTEALKQSDLEIWIDWEDIPPTADWLDQIHKGIEGSDAFLFLLSPDSATSKICTQEVTHAVQNGKRLIPIVVRDVDSAQIHPALAKVNWIYCRGENGFESALEMTLKAIRTDLAWVEFHRRLQVRALEWEKRGDSSLLLRGRDLREAEEQLASVGAKDPQPTDLQRQYALAGRRGESRTRNLILVIGAVVLVALSLLSIFANEQRILARHNAETAVANATIAGVEKENALNQEATAVANANLALARQLAAQSQLLGSESGLSMVQSALLSIESQQRYQTIEGDQALKRNLLLFPKTVATLQAESETSSDVWKIQFSPDGKSLVSAGSDRSIQIWSVATGEELKRFEHEDVVSDFDISLDGRHIVSCAGHTVYLWEIATGDRLFTTQHDGPVTSVDFSPDGKNVLSSSRDGSARIWDVLIGRELNRFEHDGIIWDATFGPDGKYVVSSGNDNARVWEVGTEEQIAELDPAARVFQSVISPDGRHVASAGEETSYVWDAATGEQIASASQPGNVLSITFSPDGYLVASGSTDGTVLIWVAGTGDEIARAQHDWTAGMDAAMGSVQAIEFSPDGRFVLSGSIDGSARMWDAQAGTEITRLAGDAYYGVNDIVDGFVNTVAFSPDGRLVAIGNSKGLIRIWEADSRLGFKRIYRGSSFFSDLSDVVISPDGSRIAYEADDDAIHVLDLHTNMELASLPLHSGIVLELGFSPDASRVFASGRDGLAWVWDVASGREIAAVEGRGIVSFSPDGEWIAAVEGENTVVVRDAETGTEISRIALVNQPTLLAFSPGKNWIVIETNAGLAGIWDARTGEMVSQIDHTGYFSRLAFSPDAKWVVSAGDDDNTVRVWEAVSGKQIAIIRHEDFIHAVGFDPLGKYLASVSGEDVLPGSYYSDGEPAFSRGTLVVLDVSTQTEVARVTFDRAVHSFTFSPDGRLLATFASSGPVRIWEVSTGMELSRISYEIFGSTSRLRFSPDGKWIVTYGYDGYLVFSFWRHEDLIEDLCSRLSRNLSRAEWRLYIGNESYRATCPKLPIEPEASPTPSR